jgi:hypothetical protein
VLRGGWRALSGSGSGLGRKMEIMEGKGRLRTYGVGLRGHDMICFLLSTYDIDKGLRSPRALHGSEWDIDRNRQLINSNTKLA